MNREKGIVFFENCKQIVPGGVSSPVRAFQDVGICPLIVEKGEGDLIYDLDGNCFIDYCMSFGALPLGHAHPLIVDAVEKQMKKGTTFGITTPLEAALALKLIQHIPSIEQLRFVSSGTEATMSAIRLARAFTQKKGIVKFNGGYHGHVDALLVKAGSGVSFLPEASSQGIPDSVTQNTYSLPYNDVETVRLFLRSHKDIAAVIVEPIAANMGLVPATQAFLETLREETLSSGALLIFDEVVTGFRTRLGSAVPRISPDLTCLGKIIGGGLPAAAFGGKKQIMSLLAPLGPVYQAGTLSGNPLSLAAGLATLSFLEESACYVELQKKADLLLEGLESEVATLVKVGSMFTFFFSQKEQFQFFYQFLFERGIYFPPSQFETCFVSLAHSESSLLKARHAISDALNEIACRLPNARIS